MSALNQPADDHLQSAVQLRRTESWIRARGNDKMQAVASHTDRTVDTPELDPATHRRILTFLNDAVVPDELVHQRMATLHEGDRVHEDNPELQRQDQET